MFSLTSPYASILEALERIVRRDSNTRFPALEPPDDSGSLHSAAFLDLTLDWIQRTRSDDGDVTSEESESW
eukprot:12410698-Karenia_brevis.AAC.1